jgi:hypothetical protein
MLRDFTRLFAALILDFSSPLDSLGRFWPCPKFEKSSSLDLLRRLRRPIRIVILITLTKNESYSHLFNLLTSHTTVQSTATLKLNYGEISRSFRWLWLMTSISEVQFYLTSPRVLDALKKLDRLSICRDVFLRDDHVAPQWSYSFTKGYFSKKLPVVPNRAKPRWTQRTFICGVHVRWEVLLATVHVVVSNAQSNGTLLPLTIVFINSRVYRILRTNKGDSWYSTTVGDESSDAWHQ